MVEWLWNPERRALIQVGVVGYNCVCSVQPKRICAYHNKLKELLTE
ncbi:MAG: hypothetical protein UT24_C0003G0018 [Candidatus Woesebacteria bacterium GW2011_GWB1_39_12]|uniref:Uncharacterized protein n=1 Tax=Candidatus Woesebacteria bacterium GW2011_GWB1_39_12 TaxID=1618574 RepID=A0A0G0MMI5_9BACT|nr:MAG: hypothetical protein UT24_C0003G0018 [Candidatus Woesebacteria bacterium GW2011_GWB1_39_12]